MKLNIKKEVNLGLMVLLAFYVATCQQGETKLNFSSTTYKKYCDSITRYDPLAVAFMNTDSARAYGYATKAVSLASAIGSDEYLVKALNEKGLVLLVNKNDSATFFLTRALKLTDTTAFKKDRGHIFYNIAQQIGRAHV